MDQDISFHKFSLYIRTIVSGDLTFLSYHLATNFDHFNYPPYFSKNAENKVLYLCQINSCLLVFCCFSLQVPNVQYKLGVCPMWNKKKK